MKMEIIRCDMCPNEHNSRYELPESWITVQRNILSADKHFCSFDCLIAWVQSEEEKRKHI